MIKRIKQFKIKVKLLEGRETLERGQRKGIVCDGYRCSGPLQQPAADVLLRLCRFLCVLQLLLEGTASLPNSGFPNYTGLDCVSKDKTIDS